MDTFTNDERREVAARLRENAGKHGGEQGPCPFCGSTDTSWQEGGPYSYDQIYCNQLAYHDARGDFLRMADEKGWY